MIKYLKPALFIIISMLISIEVSSQQALKISETVINRLKSYCTVVPREEVFIHSDRDEYVAGEDIWFNAYVFDRQSNKFSDASGLVYFEILNRYNVPVVQRRIKIESGMGPGQVLLPDTLSTGPYILRAYTNQMKNFLPENCFIKKIKIYNALNLKGTDKDYFLTNRFSDTSKKAFKAGTDAVIEVSEKSGGLREIKITTEGKGSLKTGLEYFLLIESRGNVSYTMGGYVQAETIRVSVPERSLIPGINHITIFNSEGSPVGEKYVYVPVNEGDVSVDGLSEKYGKREKVSFTVSNWQADNTSVEKRNISISVVPEEVEGKGLTFADYMIFGSEFGIVPWEILNGRSMNDLTAAEIDTLLMKIKSNWIDWDKVLSDRVPGLKYPAEKYEHFLPGRIVNLNNPIPGPGSFVLMSVPGKEAQFQYARTDRDGQFLMKVDINEKLNDLVIQPDNSENGNSVKMESPFSDNYLASELVAQSGSTDLPRYMKNMGGNFQVKKIYTTSLYGAPLKKQVNTRRITRFYGRPDQEIVLDDYIKLPVMEEVFFELIPGVFLKKKKSVFDLKISDPVSYEIYEYPPGMMIDGVIVKDPNLIGNVDPELAERIDVIKEKYFIGDYQFFGIINVITREGDFSSVILPDFATRISYRVVEPVLTFISPDYSLPAKKNERIPDFRNTLWWTPSASFNISGKVEAEFWTSDIPGTYVITVQGISSSGKLISSRKLIKVE